MRHRYLLTQLFDNVANKINVISRRAYVLSRAYIPEPMYLNACLYTYKRECGRKVEWTGNELDYKLDRPIITTTEFPRIISFCFPFFFSFFFSLVFLLSKSDVPSSRCNCSRRTAAISCQFFSLPSFFLFFSIPGIFYSIERKTQWRGYN